MLHKILTSLCLLSLFSCGATNNSYTFTPITSKNNKAIVYLYRPFVLSNAAYSPEIYVNGENKLSLKSGKKVLLTLPPGEGRFEIASDKKYSVSSAITFTLSANNIYYLRLDTSLTIKNALTYQPYQRNFKLVKIDNHNAEKEIAECCSTNKKIIGKNAARLESNSETSTDTNHQNFSEGFTVEKTQNPFSH